MAPAMLTYFAYGSNMLSARLRDRCPSARPLGCAVVTGHELRWHKPSKDGSGKCDLFRVDVQGAVAHGVLYQIDASELDALDQAEGRGHGYEQRDIVALLDGTPHTAMTYRATDTDTSLRPYSWYTALVLAGAREHRLPEVYIAMLEAVESIEDPDRARHTKKMRLIEGSYR
ncbi:MAG: gamma-glutamylcyclotransferase family protein [Thermodesulfobacteriota bacterium]